MGEANRNESRRRAFVRGLGRSLLRAIPGTIVVEAVTGLCYSLKLNLATVSFIYLVVVVLQSLLGEFSSSAAVSVICFLCLNYFFVPPIFSLRVSDASDTMALIAFLVTGLVITRLTSRAQQAANSERSQREATTRLCELAQHLLALKPEARIEKELLQQFRFHFGFRAVCLFAAPSADLYLEGDSPDLGERTKAAYIGKLDFQDSGTGVAVRLIPAGDGASGAIGFEGLKDYEQNAGPLSALAEIVVETVDRISASESSCGCDRSGDFPLRRTRRFGP